MVNATTKTFRESDRHTLYDMLRHELADDLPLMKGIHDAASFDRVRMAALKLSNGDLDTLRRAIDFGKRDWRDLLMAAAFGQLDAHSKWYQSSFNQTDED